MDFPCFVFCHAYFRTCILGTGSRFPPSRKLGLTLLLEVLDSWVNTVPAGAEVNLVHFFLGGGGISSSSHFMITFSSSSRVIVVQGLGVS